MATLRQIEANRLNAQEFTGPRADAGRDTPRFDALKHGIDAQSTVIPGENPAELQALAAGYHGQFQPRTPVERYLVNTLVNCDWLRRRLLRIQAELFRAVAGEADEAGPLYGVVYAGGFGPDGLQRLFNQISATDRAYFRALAELRRAQPSAQVPSPPRPEGAGPTEIGFVPPDPPESAPSEFPAAPRHGAVLTETGPVDPDPSPSPQDRDSGSTCSTRLPGVIAGGHPRLTRKPGRSGSGEGKTLTPASLRGAVFGGHPHFYGKATFEESARASEDAGSAWSRTPGSWE